LPLCSRSDLVLKTDDRHTHPAFIEEPRGLPRGIKSESGKIIRRKRREIDPEEINILMKNKFYELGEK